MQDFTVSPLRKDLSVEHDKRRSKSVHPQEVKTEVKNRRVIPSPSLDFPFTQVTELFPRLPKRHYTFAVRQDEESREPSPELITKVQFNEFVQHSYSTTKKVGRAPRLTERELRNIERNRLKREKLKAVVYQMNSSKEAKFTEIVDRVKREYGLIEINGQQPNKYNIFDNCID